MTTDAPIYPETTASLWLHDLAPVYSGDSITLGTTTVTFAIADRTGTIINEAVESTLIGTSFRLLFTSPTDPGRYLVLARTTAGSAVGRFVKAFNVSEVTDETP